MKFNTRTFIGFTFLCLHSSLFAACPPPGGGIFEPGGETTDSDCTITTSTAATPGTFASAGGIINLSDSTIMTSGIDSAGAEALGGGSTINLTNVDITIIGESSALLAAVEGTINMTGGTINTSNTAPNAVEATSFYSTVNLTGVTVTASGTVVEGALATGGGIVNLSDTSLTVTSTTSGDGARADLGSILSVTNGSSIVTNGDNNHGVVIDASSFGTVTDSTIETNGDSSYGAYVDGNSSLNMTNASIITKGTNAYGLIADLSTATLNNTSILTVGADSAGVYVLDGATVSLNNSTVSTTNTGSSAILISAIPTITNTLDATNTVFSAYNATLMTVDGGDAAVSFTQVTAKAANGQDFLDVDGGTLSFTSSGSLLSGNINVTGGGIADLRFTNATIYTGAMQNVTSLFLDGTSVWELTGNSTVGSLTNAGAINFIFRNKQYHRLTVTDYVGQSPGRISLNTFLQQSNSPSDLLIINGGSAKGKTGLFISNTMGKGAVTTGNGILIVETINGGTTTPHSFSLVNSLVAGPYEYTLQRGNASATHSPADNWYLRSTIYAPNEPGHDINGFVPNYRRETSLYAAMPSLELLYGRSLLGTFHQREGQEAQVHGSAKPTFLQGAWTRAIVRGGDINNDDIFHDGPDFNYHFQALQTGIDLLHLNYKNGQRDFAGVYGTVGSNNGDVEHFTGVNAGNAAFFSYGVGLYWTHIGPQDWYIDAVVQGERFEPNVAPNTNDYGASLEGGYPFMLTPNLSLEPQAQLVYQTLNGASTSETATTIHFDSAQSFVSRLGARLVWNSRFNDLVYFAAGKQYSVWLTASTWYDSKGQSTVSFSSATGMIPFNSTVNGAWFEGDLGATVQLSRDFYLYGTLTGETYYNGRGNSYDVIAGARVNL